MAVYYNEFYPPAADKLEQLIARGLVAPGEVDRRSIVDVRADDLRRFKQAHFFAGIGGWSMALRLAGIPDDAKIWTGSCPCQPFSIASVNPETAAKGQADERHLLPHFAALAIECRASTVVGEQVRNAIKWGWLDEAACRLEAGGYAFAASVFSAFPVGTRHKRDRIYWMADAGGAGWPGYQPVQRFPVTAAAAQSLYGDPLAGARRALDGDYSHLLPSDGISVVMERVKLHHYGNAIVPQAAAAFLRAAFMEAA